MKPLCSILLVLAVVAGADAQTYCVNGQCFRTSPRVRVSAPFTSVNVGPTMSQVAPVRTIVQSQPVRRVTRPIIEAARYHGTGAVVASGDRWGDVSSSYRVQVMDSGCTGGYRSVSSGSHGGYQTAQPVSSGSTGGYNRPPTPVEVARPAPETETPAVEDQTGATPKSRNLVAVAPLPPSLNLAALPARRFEAAVLVASL